MMQQRIVIVGSGPAAAGAALALLRTGQTDITVLDLGSELEPATREVVRTLGAHPRQYWSDEAVRRISAQPVATVKGELPQKRSYGSDFPFRNAGQLHSMGFAARANSSPVSGAYGGFSNVWGAQVMPFSRATFETWPVGWDAIAPHYSAVLEEVPLAGEADDLADAFPLLTDRARPLPPLSARTSRVLEEYARNRGPVRDAGVTVGRARLALAADSCVSCGLCMTGCPYGLIYSAAQTFDRLRRGDLVRYQPGTLVTGLGEDAEGCSVVTRSTVTGQRDTIRADRVFVACGGIGSTRLVLGSLAHAPRSFTMSESVQFAVPFLSRRSTGDPRAADDFTLNQFNILVDFDDEQYHSSQVHCYPYNPSVLSALPAPLRSPMLNAFTSRMLGRLTIGLGYLPSWASPAIQVEVGDGVVGELPQLTIGAPGRDSTPLMLQQVLRRLRRVGAQLDLHPVTSQVRLSGTAKSYHFGASLPHRADTTVDGLCTDVLGRPPGWQRIHIVDGAVLPSVPSTTFTLTVMANAHRIATASLATP